MGLEDRVTRSQDFHSPYCLYCYAPMEPDERASQTCGACGSVNLREDRRAFWSKEPRLVSLERSTQIFIGILIGAMALAILADPSGGSGAGKGHGMAVGLPILLGVLLLDVTSAITRRRAMFGGTMIWLIMGPLMLVLTAPVSLLFWKLDMRLASMAMVGTALVSVVALVLLPILGFGKTEKLRARRIAERQAGREAAA